MEAWHPGKSGDEVGGEWSGRNRYAVPTTVSEGAVSHVGWSEFKESCYVAGEVKCVFNV